MVTALWISGIYFTAVDLRSHRIPNKALLVFSLGLLFFAKAQSLQIHFTFALITLIVGTLLSIFAGLGFGDVKLLTILSLFVVAPTRLDLVQFLFGLTIASAIALVFTAVRAGKFQGSIPMAPSIFAGAILCASLT